MIIQLGRPDVAELGEWPDIVSWDGNKSSKTHAQMSQIGFARAFGFWGADSLFANFIKDSGLGRFFSIQKRTPLNPHNVQKSLRAKFTNFPKSSYATVQITLTVNLWHWFRTPPLKQSSYATWWNTKRWISKPTKIKKTMFLKHVAFFRFPHVLPCSVTTLCV